MTPAERQSAKGMIMQLEKSRRWKAPIVTEVLPLNVFYRAEPYHQGYAFRNPGNSYVSNVSIPEYQRFCRSYKGALKENRRK